MFIERLQVEEGFLDGLDIHCRLGLNTIIGARGTGKTSVIELIRFGLDVKSFTQESQKRSLEHARAVLGSGRVTVTLQQGEQSLIVSRSADEETPRVVGAFTKPIILSQSEVESVGLKPSGRLQLIDSFGKLRARVDEEEARVITEIERLMSERAALRAELEDLARQVADLPAIMDQIAALAPAEGDLAKVSEQTAAKKSILDQITAQTAQAAVTSAAIQRFRLSTERWETAVRGALQATPHTEAWPREAGADVLSPAREQWKTARDHLEAAVKALAGASSISSGVADSAEATRLKFEETARALRREIEGIQSGAGVVMRQGQQLRERKAQLEALQRLRGERQKALVSLTRQRDQALDRLDEARQRRFQERAAIVERLNRRIGPRVRIQLLQAGQTHSFASTIAEILRGSGLRYNDLALLLAERVSPRELLEAIEARDVDGIAEATGISRNRSASVIDYFATVNITNLAIQDIEDGVDFELLDGAEYKQIDALSTGQRCTVILPIILQHNERVLILDQPEDHIDNAFIVDTLIQAIGTSPDRGQMIVSTHNANIPVLGEAEQIIHMGSDGRRGYALSVAPLDSEMSVDAITSVMEGGSLAFRRRAEFYDRQR